MNTCGSHAAFVVFSATTFSQPEEVSLYIICGTVITDTRVSSSWQRKKGILPPPAGEEGRKGDNAGSAGRSAFTGLPPAATTGWPMALSERARGAPATGVE